ncbi:hypothetical protein M409DRAFT_36955 [Zasmidium cellare ATCC 36951]|uniref:D-isomer specific 2-hydroxyacid dehydrogenase NAD-binding domain-containing protein n=1 Tax=Zasmidium cellare ATCC 36951 TaxID=1080233 RepID=A0A6A6CH70_ZASCE|nr:uncharacterized protein M409DRAFT_36955 [Zasmidium cellare ATCC 36951]KAF2165292.1 hypothetical protein M409DRAFT_36955 [Zasmidium cellare ATCC 36951]
MKVVITHWVHEEVTTFLGSFAQVKAPTTPGQVWPQDRVLLEAADADAVITCMADSVNEAFLKACPNLKIIAATLKGYDNYDVEACKQHNVQLTIVPDIIIPPTAELAVSLALGIIRNVRQGDETVRSGNFTAWRPLHYGMSLSGAVVGFVGMGNLGQAIARLLSPFGVSEMAYYDQSERHTPEGWSGPAWKRAGLQTLLSSCDLIIVSLPLLPSTQHLLDSKALESLRPGAYIVNIGRGSVVDENGILDALNSGRLSGYAADVFEFEDWALASRPKDIPQALRQHPRTLFTPHLGSAVDNVRKEMSMKAAEQVRSLLAAEVPEFAVNQVKQV